MIQKIISAQQKSIPFSRDFVQQTELAPKGYLRLKDVRIVGEYSLICDKMFRPIDCCLNEFLYWQPSPLKTTNDVAGEIKKRKALAYKSAMSSPKQNFISLDTENDYVYLMSSFGWYPYGHLFDTFQRLYSLQGLPLLHPQYLCCDYRRVSDFAMHLKFLGIPGESLLSFNKWDVIEIPNLVVGFTPSWTAHFTYETINWIFESYITKNIAFSDYCSVRSKEEEFILYLDRESTGRRRVNNNGEIKKSLIDAGYPLKVFHGDEGLLETMWLFNNAKVVVGGHGAAFLNTLFCNENALILEFCSATRPYKAFLEMPKPAVNHELILVDSDENHNIEIDINYVKERLQQVLM